MNEERAREGARDPARQLPAVLERPVELGHAAVVKTARKRAVDILSSIAVNHSDLQQAIHSTLASLPERTAFGGG